MGIATPIPYTLLSLSRYAQIMGINPVHFAGGYSDAIFPVTNNSCQDIWARYSWQNADSVSHEDLARAILDAENEIANYLGYYPAPRWVSKEIHPYTRYHRREYTQINGLSINGTQKTTKLRWGKYIQFGPRATTLVGTATVAGGTLTYTDDDGDGFYETATIILPTSLTDEYEIKPFIAGKSGAMEWEIRPVRSKSISGGSVTIVIDSWLLIEPDTLSAYPTTAGYAAITLNDTTNFVTSVEVYREYTDTTSAAQLIWNPRVNAASTPFIVCSTCGGTGCAACSITLQDACVHVVDVDNSIVVLSPAEYDASSEAWEAKKFTECREPDQVKVWYYAGNVSEPYLAGRSYEPLDDHMAQTIAYLATARLERPYCSCGNVTSLANWLQVDTAQHGEAGGFLVNFETLLNPLGTKMGEVIAWRRLSSMNHRSIGACVV